MITLHTDLDPVRRSLLLALGLLVPVIGCGDSGGGASDGDATNVTASGLTSSGATGSDSTATSEPTGSASGTGDTSTGGPASSTATTDATTSGVSATEATSAGETTIASTSTGGEGTSEGGDTLEPGCEELMQATDPPIPSGWVLCEGRLPNRVEQVACEVTGTTQKCQMNDPQQQCMTDADCVAQPFGSCHEFTGIGLFGCGCVYGCQTDADCEAGSVCRCGGPGLGPFTTCTPSTCADDSECGDEVCQFANSYGEDCPFEVNGGQCSTPADTCQNDLQCGSTGCGWDEPAKAWQCANTICGRPFVVEAQAVTAPAVDRDDWRGLVRVPTSDAGLAARLAAHWTQIGLYEHASVASFARFMLQLLAVGAPASLVSEAQRALADEVEHARVCFALASLYKGTGVGPGPLPQAHDAGVSGLAEITAAVIREACVGETLSALEVRESAARAEDPALRQALSSIADDEQRHAELGWRFVQWALAQLGDEEKARLTEVFAEAIAAAELQAVHMAAEVGAPELRAHGVIDAPLRASVWLRGLAAIVRPSVTALAA